MDLSADYGTSNEACGCGGGEGVVVVVGGLLCIGGRVKGEELLWLLWQEFWLVVVGYGWRGEGCLRKDCGGDWWLWRFFFWRVVNKKKSLWLLSGKAVCNRWNRWSLIVFHFVLNSLGGEPGGRNGIIWRESINWFKKIRQGYGR